jgi:hypothetical protein
MTLRFRALAVKAGVVSAEYNGFDANELSASQRRFAELIVQECIAQCEQVATAADAKSKSKFVTDDGRMLHEGMWGGAKNCSGQIKQHFGVEE